MNIVVSSFFFRVGWSCIVQSFVMTTREDVIMYYKNYLLIHFIRYFITNTWCTTSHNISVVELALQSGGHAFNPSGRLFWLRFFPWFFLIKFADLYLMGWHDFDLLSLSLLRHLWKCWLSFGCFYTRKYTLRRKFMVTLSVFWCFVFFLTFYMTFIINVPGLVLWKLTMQLVN